MVARRPPASPPPERSRIQLVVLSKPKQVFDLDVELTASASAFRRLVATRTRLDAPSFWVVHKGRVVKGDWCLGTFGVHANSKVHVVLKPDGRRPANTATDLWQDWRERSSSGSKAAVVTSLLMVLFRRILQRANLLDDAASAAAGTSRASSARKSPRRAVSADGRSVQAVTASTVASRAHGRRGPDDGRVLRDSEVWADKMLHDHPLLRWSGARSRMHQQGHKPWK